MALEYRRLGRTGLKVSVLSFGSWVTFGPQLAGSLAGITPKMLSGIEVCDPSGRVLGMLGGLVLAYEPVWAIGTGEVATPQDAEEVCAALRGRISAVHGDAVGAGMRILYGGSVKPDNMPAIMAQPDVDGALVGGASLDAGEFVRICRYRDQSTTA